MLAAAERPLHRRRRRHHQRRRRGPAGRVRRADRRAGRPDPDGLGHDPRRPPADGRHGRPADLAPLRQRDDAGSPTSCWASATGGPTGTPAALDDLHARAARSCTSTSSRPRSAGSSRPTTASSPTPRPRWSCSSRWPASARRPARCRTAARGPRTASERKQHAAAQDPLRQRADQAAAGLRGDEQGVRQGRPLRLAPSACRRSPAAQFLHVYKPRHWINCRPGRAAGLDRARPRSGVATADPDATVVALSGDYDFQFMIEELAVGAQFNIPYIHVLVNNAYLGLIRQSQRGFDMDYCVQLSFDNINAPEVERLRRRPRQGGRGPGLQGDPGLRARRDPARRSSRPRR